MRYLTTLAVLFAVAACDKGAGDGAGAGKQGESAGADATATDAGKADPEAKAKFVKAYVEAACAVKTSKDISKAVELTRKAYEKHGFNQVSYAAATKRWAQDADVMEAQKKGLMECAAPTDADQAVDKKPAKVAGEGEGEGEKKGADKSGEGEGEGEKAAKEDGGEAKGKAAGKGSPYAGKWAGTMTSKDVSAILKFHVNKTGKLVGEVKGKKPKKFTFSFKGQARDGKFMLNGRKKTAPHGAMLKGAVDAKGVVVGEWDGTIAKKRQKGTWRAAKK